MVLGKNVRLLYILSERREIESHRQLCETEKKRERELRELETKKKTKARPQNERPATRWTSALETDSILSSKREQETRFEGCRMWIERPFMTRETWSIQEMRVAARNKGSWSSSSLNVTQAAGHKERWREDISVDDVAGYHCQAWECVMKIV